MRVTVDDERCRGHGVCCSACPEVFTLTDDGYAVAKAEIPAELAERVRSAAESCPERAITAQ
ncbi:ferredoxin [Amycolatopsis sp. K13G38]|uniref:Ferredoxin n=1 Tax=Amycolatopsis acididurans TaxID=2724524 RepID=A0ABX1IZL6_9PSEU|nr:ferredoxin [Amycolatopsis acididurans]NKQ51481.1 ferredoxin [Amycolatopsis acididurans]